MRLRTVLFTAPVALFLFSAGLVEAHTNVQPGFNLFSAQQDADIGRQSAAQVERQLPVLNTPAATRLVERLGQRLAAQANGPNFAYRFKVLNLSDVNAFALPGGYIYVHRGLIDKARTEDELAGVIAHEIAHVSLRHPTHNLSRAYMAQAGLGLLSGLLGGGHAARSSQVVEAVGGFGLNALFLKFSRSMESEADAVGGQIMARAGYDPAQMANFFAQMRVDAGREPSGVARFLSDHPAPSDREYHIRSEARALQVADRAPVGGLQAAKSELRQLPPAPKMSQLASASRSARAGWASSNP
jgi:predicted Zn-dependent protease